MILSDRGIGIPDNPLSPYVLASWGRSARLVAELACEQGLGDAVAWEAFCGDVTTWGLNEKGKPWLHLASGLAAFKAVHGNRKSRPRRKVRRG